MPGDHPSRILVDLDGVMTIGKGHGALDFAPMRTGATAFLKALREDLDFDEVVVCTARTDIQATKNFLRQNGLLNWVDEVTNQKLPAKVFLDDRAIGFQGDFDAALRQIRDFRPYWEKNDASPTLDTPEKREYSSTQVNLPAEASEVVLQMGREIQDQDLGPEGREKEPHITALYGIHDNSPDALTSKLRNFGRIRVRLGKTSLFERPEADVLKIDVDSPDLHRLHKLIARTVPNTQTFPEYKPHLTIGYCLPKKGSFYVGNKRLEGKRLEFETLVFSGADGTRAEIPLK